MARCASEMGRNFSHFPKERTAKVLGMLSTSHGFVVVGRVSRLAGSKTGGAVVLELFMRARWMGVAAGLGLTRSGRCSALCDVFTHTCWLKAVRPTSLRLFWLGQAWSRSPNLMEEFGL